MSEKIVGYSLLSIGIVAILFALYSVFQVFTKATKPIQLFDFPPIQVGAEQIFNNMTQLTKSETPKIELLPASILNESSNVIAHVFLMGFVASIGYKLGMLGVYMIRPIKVNVKEGTTNDSTQKK